MLKQLISIILCSYFLSEIASANSVSESGRGPFYVWANTPVGKFECVEEKTGNENYVLKLDGKIIHEGNFHNDSSSDFLEDGLGNDLGHCPDILENKNGYLIIIFYQQPPFYGVYEYAVINFHQSEKSVSDAVAGRHIVSELGTGQSKNDKKIPIKERIKWDEKGFTFTYFGYEMNEECCTKESPRSQMHAVRYDFKSSTTYQLR